MAYDNTPTVNVTCISVFQNHGDFRREIFLGTVAVLRKDNNGWALPGGFQERPEHIKAAAMREVREETGIELESVSIYSAETVPNGDVNLIFWTAEISLEEWTEAFSKFVPNEEILQIELKTDLWDSIFPMHKKVADNVYFWYI